MVGMYDSKPFISDIILPEQFAHLSAAANSPERRLMLAVFESSLHDYQQNKGMGSRRACRLFHETEEWFRSADTTWLFSFENICMVLGLDAQAVREALFRKDSQSQMPTIRVVAYNHKQGI